MKELKKIAEETRKQLDLKYDLASVKFLAEFIEQNKSNVKKDNLNKLINSYGAFLGECVIENYGGSWKKMRMKYWSLFWKQGHSLSI